MFWDLLPFFQRFTRVFRHLLRGITYSSLSGDENDMQSRVGIRRDKESGKEYQVVLNDKDENSNYHSTGCMCSCKTKFFGQLHS